MSKFDTRPKSASLAVVCMALVWSCPCYMPLAFHWQTCFTKQRCASTVYATAVFLLARLQTWRALIFSQVCLSVCVCLWPALIPFSVNRFSRNLVTRTLLWSSLVATIMVQIGRRGTARRLFENFKKILKNHRIRILEFWSIIFCMCLLCIVKKIDSIRRKLTEEIHFEVCHSGNLPPIECCALTAPACSSSRRQRCADPEMLRPHHSTDSDHRFENWGRSRAVKTNRLVLLCCAARSDDWRGLFQWFLYRDRLGADGAGCLERRHTHQHDPLQGRVGGVRRTIPSAGERRLVHLPQHRHSVAGDVADIRRH